MTKPPERIFAWPSECYYQGVSLAGGHPDRMVEYIRADLVTQCTPDPAVQALVEAARNEGYRAGLKSMADTIESAKVRLTLGQDWITADQQELTAQAYRHIARAALAAFDKTDP